MRCGAVESSKRFTTAQSRITSLALLLIQNSNRVEIYLRLPGDEIVTRSLRQSRLLGSALPALSRTGVSRVGFDVPPKQAFLRISSLRQHANPQESSRSPARETRALPTNSQPTRFDCGCRCRDHRSRLQPFTDHFSLITRERGPTVSAVEWDAALALAQT